MPNALIVDDEHAVAWGLRRGLERAGFTAYVAATAEDGLKQLPSVKPEAVFLDVRLPGMDGLTALPRFTAAAPTIVMTAHGDLDTAVRAVAGGAFDYLAKPFDLDQAISAARRASERNSNSDPEPAANIIDRDTIVGRSPALQNVFKRIALVAPTDACVLITGESGTGKELAARAVHTHSPRRNKPFVPVHVAGLNPNLVESELFGHVKGAFTGADRAHPGLLVLAAGGTVFLDELGDIPLPVQAKLLRVLERREVDYARARGCAHCQRDARRVVPRGGRGAIPSRSLLSAERVSDPHAGAARPHHRRSHII
jgi:two-component system, NtrC family, nitrogen regulation response regulator GlnG